MPSSPTEHPAWVQIFEYATQPSTDPAAVRAVSNSGSTRRTITWASSTPTNPSGNTVAIWSSPFALGGERLAVARDEPAADRPVGPGPLAARLRPQRADRPDESDHEAGQ